MQSTSIKAASILAAEWIRELEGEVRSTRECLQEVPMDKADWKPHDKSMPLSYLAQLVADIPRWIQYIIEKPLDWAGKFFLDSAGRYPSQLRS